MTEYESYLAEKEHLPDFLCGRWIDIPFETLEDLLETAVYDFKLDHDDGKLVHEKKISLSDRWDREDFVDCVMIFSYPYEGLDLSIARLAKAARYLGFTELTPYAAAVCYSRFNSLRGKYR